MPHQKVVDCECDTFSIWRLAHKIETSFFFDFRVHFIPRSLSIFTPNNGVSGKYITQILGTLERRTRWRVMLFKGTISTSAEEETWSILKIMEAIVDQSPPTLLPSESFSYEVVTNFKIFYYSTLSFSLQKDPVEALQRN
ncbi:hypothetical protein YC2023_021754 [Brassica napus]